MGPGKPGAAIDGAFGCWAEPSGKDESHPWGSDLSTPELYKPRSKVCSWRPWLGGPGGEEVTEAGRLLGPGGESQEAGSRVPANPGPTRGQAWAGGSELLQSGHPSPWEDALKGKPHPQG